MSDQMVLFPVLSDTEKTEREQEVPVLLGELNGRNESEVGWRSPGETLVLTPEGALGLKGVGGDAVGTAAALKGKPVARFRCQGESGKDGAVALVPVVPGLRANGRRIVGLKLLRPGATLSLPGSLSGEAEGAGDGVGQEVEYLLVRRYQASRRPAPPELAEKACGVCGMPLELAEVSACSCGIYYHSQVPVGEGADAEPLACFTESRFCIHCKREKTYDPVLLPSPESLGLGS